MKMLVEFSWNLVEKFKCRYIWLEISRDIEIKEFFLKYIGEILGQEIGESLYKLFLDGEIMVIVNGLLVKDPSKKLRSGDRILIQPIASGG